MAIERKRQDKPPPLIPRPEHDRGSYYGVGDNWAGRPMRPALSSAGDEEGHTYQGRYPYPHPPLYPHRIGPPQPPYITRGPILPRKRSPQLPPPPRLDLSPSVPYTQQPDPRLPPAGVYPPDLIDFPSADLEFAAHRIRLLAPDSPALAALLARARDKRALSLAEAFPEDLVARSLRSNSLWHVSNGPRGGVWVVETGKEEVVVALVEEMEALKEERVKDKGALGREIGVRDVDPPSARWEVLGVGAGGSEGRVFLLHGCGRGPVVVGKEKKEGKKGLRGRVKGNSEPLRGWPEPLRGIFG